MDGVFLENGPWRVKKDLTLKIIDGSWVEYANMLYVDQPVGTGFSYANKTGYLTNVTQVPGEFILFLDKFFEIFPEYSKDDMYIAGESFAGTFIPYIAAGILNRNNERNTAENHKVIILKVTAENQLSSCMAIEKANFTIHNDLCEEVLLTVLKSSRKTVGKKITCINQYDIRDHSDSYPSCGLSWPYELPSMYAYLRRVDVVKAIHAEGKGTDWVECSSPVSRAFDNDKSPPSVELLPSLLKQINVLLYRHNNTKTSLFSDNAVYGYMISERNLTYVLMYNSSHMVPYDVPIPSMDMMYRFMGMRSQTIKFPSGTTYKVNLFYFIRFQRFANSLTLIIVICGVVSLAVFVYRGKLKSKRSVSQAMKAAVESSNSEMDELVIEQPLFQSDNVDHFGDSEEEDNGHGQSLESGMHNNQDRYVDDEEQGRYVDEEQTKYVDEKDYDERTRIKPSEDQ
ncbi:8516_t:CDS:10 [Scutellospora calospora]|uniref:8516_t:CDS:1 n=1 Tax=Scutellospora calospora TaxID=85575 RepID=A0ACA9JV98_9GLOM|nr:8516_t:CDS:10 [Scutellospora calospora]